MNQSCFEYEDHDTNDNDAVVPSRRATFAR